MEKVDNVQDRCTKERISELKDVGRNFPNWERKKTVLRKKIMKNCEKITNSITYA